MDGFKEIKICIGYEIGSKKIDYIPSSTIEQKKIKPIYETMKGWQGSIVGIRNIKDLPVEAQLYVQRIEELISCKVDLVSTSPERDDTIVIKNPFLIS